MVPRHAEVIYCDDIRHEVNNKLSFIGVYTGDLLAPQFPYTASKLFMYVSAVTPASQPFASLSLRVLKDEEVLLETAIPAEQLASQTASQIGATLSSDAASERLFAMHFALHAANLLLSGPCTLRVRVQTESEELRARALSVRLNETPSSAQ